MKIIKIIILLNSIIFTNIILGQSYFNVDINSFGSYDMNNKTYYIESCMDNMPTNDLEFLEYASHIERTLKVKGANRTMDREEADVFIMLFFDLTDESYTEIIPKPIWGQTGVTSIATNTYSLGNGSVNGYYSNGYGYIDGQGNSSTSSLSTYNYSYGITGYHNVTVNVENYNRIINLYAYDNRDKSNAKMLWKLNLTSEGSIDDFRIVFPFLAFATIPYIGFNSRARISTSINTNDYLYKLWCAGVLSKEDNIYLPTFEKMNDKKLDLFLVERSSQEIVVNIYEIYSPVYDRIWVPKQNTCFIKIENDEIVCSKKEEIHGVGYIVLRFHFPINEFTTEKFDFIRYDKPKRTKILDAWYNIH